MTGGLRELSGLIRGEDAAIPWFLPGVAVSAAISLVAGGRAARWLATRRAVGTLLLFAAGIVVSATLTPGGGEDAAAAASRGAVSCDFSRIGLPPLGLLRGLNEVSLNVVLFAPLGFAIGLLPRSRRTLAVVLAAIAFPFVIEATQALVTPLGRGCESADVIDNLLGLVGGMVVGVVARTAVVVAGGSLEPALDSR